jgi:hypothetical protein
MSDRYVVAELHGRLGNQLFQFASAYGIARRRDARLVFASAPVPPDDLLLPKLLGTHYREATPRELLGVGKLAYRVPMRRAFASLLYRGSRAWRRARGRTPPSITHWDNTGRFRPVLDALDLPVYLQGHLQSECYFADFADDIAAWIAWPASSGVPELPRPAIGVSVRRGDYEPLGWTVPLDFYERAVECITRRVDASHVVLFGDEPEFVATAAIRLAKFGPVTDTVALGHGPISQLHLLSMCDHCVIANSSFSWWGAWLGDQYARDPGRIVVAPREYGEQNDRIPPRWETIPTGTPRF